MRFAPWLSDPSHDGAPVTSDRACWVRKFVGQLFLAPPSAVRIETFRVDGCCGNAPIRPHDERSATGIHENLEPVAIGIATIGGRRGRFDPSPARPTGVARHAHTQVPSE